MNRLEELFSEGNRQGTLSHAYLIETEEADRPGLGRRLAAAVLCEKGTLCGTCPACRAVLAGNHPDVITVTHEKPELIAVKEIRAQLVDDMLIRPYRAEKKIYLVPDAEKMNPQAQNALLKTLEEPPVYGMVLLLTGNREAFLPTVLSRCVCLTGAAGEEAAAGALQETVFGFLHRAEHLPVTEMFGFAGKCREAGGLLPALDLIRAFLRDVLLVKTQNEDRLFFPEELRYTGTWAKTLSDRTLGRLLESVAAAEGRIKANVNPDLAAESLLLDIRDALAGKNVSDREEQT